MKARPVSDVATSILTQASQQQGRTSTTALDKQNAPCSAVFIPLSPHVLIRRCLVIRQTGSPQCALLATRAQPIRVGRLGPSVCNFDRFARALQLLWNRGRVICVVLSATCATPRLRGRRIARHPNLNLKQIPGAYQSNAFCCGIT
jgi:hypothetical protein